jgi:predicted RNA-binding Zn-ribbon protein involved in translation (DUF1610 family)
MSLDNLIVDLHNVNFTENETCMICREDLHELQTYKLPECGHEYHTHCLISWFRNGDSRCPYCGNKGINHIECKKSRNNSFSFRRRFNRFDNNDLKLGEIKKYAKNHEAPKLLINQLKKLDEAKNKLTVCNENLKDFKNKINNEPLIFKDAKNEILNLRRQKLQAESNVRKMRFFIDELNIVPLIIPQPININ